MVEPADESGDHRDARTADAGEQRADLCDTDRAGFLEVERVESSALLTFAASRRMLGDRACGPWCAGVPVRRTSKITPLTVRKIAAASGLANSVRRACSNTRPVSPAGIVATISSHAMRSSGVSRRRVRSVRKKPPMIRYPVLSEVDEQCDRGRHVQRDDEREIERLARGLRGDEVIPTQPCRDQHRVTEARDREQFGDALQQADHDRLEVAQHGGAPLGLGGNSCYILCSNGGYTHIGGLGLAYLPPPV